MPVRTVSHFLDELHYLGATGRGFAWSDEYGVIVLAKPTSRRLPQDGTWLELVRWCLVGTKNGGSRQWSQVAKWLRAERRDVTTVVSYSDPSAGHTGALYKACNWTWAPTWHRLRPPPSGNGAWQDGVAQSVKDRWIFVLRRDDRRAELLRVKDESIVRRLDDPNAAASSCEAVSPTSGASHSVRHRNHGGADARRLRHPLDDRRVGVDAEAPPAPPDPPFAPLPGHRPVLPPAPEAGTHTDRQARGA